MHLTILCKACIMNVDQIIVTGGNCVLKRFNRIFACLLAVALLACACSGCGKKSEEPSFNCADAKNERYYAPLT